MVVAVHPPDQVTTSTTNLVPQRHSHVRRQLQSKYNVTTRTQAPLRITTTQPPETPVKTHLTNQTNNQPVSEHASSPSRQDAGFRLQSSPLNRSTHSNTVYASRPQEMAEDIDLSEVTVEALIHLDPELRRTLEKEAVAEYKTLPQFESHGAVAKRKGRHDNDTAMSVRRANSTSDGRDDDESSDEVDSKYCCELSRSAIQLDGVDASYCQACKMIFCMKCWASCPPHRRAGRLGFGHEKIEPNLHWWVSATLEAQANENDQATNHLLDNSALWFGAGPDDRGVPVFRDFGRYPSLMAETADVQRSRRSPSLVSFVGDTGAGKSSLIKLLISMKADRKPCHTPVVGLMANDDTPTSGDVHLYSDPHTAYSTDPILYADTEGLNGGIRDPVGAMYKKRCSGNVEARLTQSSALRSHLRQNHSSSEREILWARTPESSNREYFVRHLYPRLLYTFSDVIVFVVKNARAIDNVIEQLITWADACIEASSNQPNLPHAIIVLNAVEGGSRSGESRQAGLWDVDTATENLLTRVLEKMDTKSKFKSYADSRRKAGAIVSSVRSLLLCYYSSVRLVRVPNQDEPRLIHKQVTKLYQEITDASRASQNSKLRVRMKLSAEELQPYLHKAFDHFCRTLTEPFDFVKASYANCTIPSDFAGNILKLLLQMLELWRDRLDARLLFKEISFMLASCAMLDAVRRGILGLTESVFPRYIPHLDEALQDFCDRSWPCEYVCADGRCVNVKAGHSKGHQLVNARVVEAGAAYMSSFTAADYRDEFFTDVFNSLEQLLQCLEDRKRDSSMTEGEAAISLHRDLVLKHFYRHLGGAENFVSHSVCLACLVFAPQHSMPCGHILCKPCVEACGRSRGPAAVDLGCCPLHTESVFHPRYMVTFQPPTAGVRILTLDGGGIRGIVELASLLAIEKELGPSLRIQSFFDLIVGTSTGGVIALGIGEKNMSVGECKRKFETLASTVFAGSVMTKMKLVEKFRTLWKHGRYDVDALESTLVDQFGQDRLFGGPKEHTLAGRSLRPRVAVTATSVDGSPYLFANYNRAEPAEDPGYVFLRAERQNQEIRVWEAARATSAAPRIFRPFDHQASGHSFMDGGIYHNNPIEVAMREYKFLFPEMGDRLPDLVLSLGTAFDARKPKSETTPVVPAKGPLSYHKHLIKIATDHLRHSLNSEMRWDRFIDNQREDDRSRFHRVNFELSEKLPKLDDVSRMHQLKDIIDHELQQRRSKIKKIARSLLATSFYFQPLRQPIVSRDGLHHLEGTIECRFPLGSDEIVAIGELLLQQKQSQYNRLGAAEGPSFVFQERRREKEAKQNFIPDDVIQAMKTEGKFDMKPVKFPISNLLAEVDIYFRLGHEPYGHNSHSISGFPRCWEPVDARPSLRPSLSLSQRRRFQPSNSHPEWSKVSDKVPDSLAEWTKSDHPGLATAADLERVTAKLSTPIRPTSTAKNDENMLIPAPVACGMGSDPSSQPPVEFYNKSAELAALTPNAVSTEYGSFDFSTYGPESLSSGSRLFDNHPGVRPPLRRVTPPLHYPGLRNPPPNRTRSGNGYHELE